jgi:hypothetical protein
MLLKPLFAATAHRNASGYWSTGTIDPFALITSRPSALSRIK